MNCDSCATNKQTSFHYNTYYMCWDPPPYPLTFLYHYFIHHRIIRSNQNHFLITAIGIIKQTQVNSPTIIIIIQFQLRRVIYTTFFYIYNNQHSTPLFNQRLRLYAITLYFYLNQKLKLHV